MNLGRDRPNNFYGLGQDRPRRDGLGQHRAGPAWAAQRGENYFSPPPPASCMQDAGGENANEKKERKTQGKGCVPGVEEAVAGGAGVAWLVDGGSGRRRCGCSVCSLSLSSLLLVSVLFFSFSFFVFGLVSVFPPACSLSLLSPLSPSVSSKKSPLSLLRSSHL